MKLKQILIVSSLTLLVAVGVWYFFFKKSDNQQRIEEILKDFVQVDGGTFIMGAPDSIGADDEIQHSVNVATFYMQTTEVTQELYELVMGENPSENKAWKDMPVTNVSWEDCQAFIKKLNEITGKEYRLPTEAEWEYAARGGSKSLGYLYAGSNTLSEVGWYDENSGEAIHVIKEKKPNELGLYDMSGNVWEWCSDWYGPYRTDVKGSDNPKGPDNGEYRVLRGGSWHGNANGCRSTIRGRINPGGRYDFIGFRLVLPAVR